MSLPIQPLFDKSQDAYSTDYAAMGLHGVNAFDWRRQPVVLTPEQLKHADYKADQLVRHHERKADAHRDDMRKRMAATRAKEKATRVNPETNWAAPSGEALHRKEIRQELARAA